MSRRSMPSTIGTIGIDIGNNTFYLVGLDPRGAIVLQLQTSREPLERRFGNAPRCLIGMEARKLVSIACRADPNPLASEAR